MTVCFRLPPALGCGLLQQLISVWQFHTKDIWNDDQKTCHRSLVKDHWPHHGLPLAKHYCFAKYWNTGFRFAKVIHVLFVAIAMFMFIVLSSPVKASLRNLAASRRWSFRCSERTLANDLPNLGCGGTPRSVWWALTEPYIYICICAYMYICAHRCIVNVHIYLNTCLCMCLRLWMHRRT